MNIRIDSKNFERFLARLKSPETMHGFLVDLGQEMEFQVDQSFHKQESPGGKPWKPLSPITKFLRRGSTYHKLVNTGRLRNSIQSDVSDKTVATGTDYFVAAVHNEGRVILPKTKKALYFGAKGKGFFMLRKATIPQRQFMPVKGKKIPLRFKQAAIRTADDHFAGLA